MWWVRSLNTIEVRCAEQQQNKAFSGGGGGGGGLDLYRIILCFLCTGGYPSTAVMIFSSKITGRRRWEGSGGDAGGGTHDIAVFSPIGSSRSLPFESLILHPCLCAIIVCAGCASFFGVYFCSKRRPFFESLGNRRVIFTRVFFACCSWLVRCIGGATCSGRGRHRLLFVQTKSFFCVFFFFSHTTTTVCFFAYLCFCTFIFHSCIYLSVGSRNTFFFFWFVGLGFVTFWCR